MFNTEGEIIAHARMKAKLTQAELSKKLGYVSPQFVSNWERNISKMPRGSFGKLAKYLGKKPLQEVVDLRVKAFRDKLLKALS